MSLLQFYLIILKSQFFFEFWGPMEDTFFSYMLSTGLYCNQKLRTSSIIYRGSGFHQLKKMFEREHCPISLFNFCNLLTNTFCRFRCIEPFPSCWLFSTICCLFLISLFWLAILASFGSQVLFVDPVKWAILCPSAESLEFEA